MKLHNLSKHFIIFVFSALFFSTEAKAQLDISYGDDSQKVLTIIKNITNLINTNTSQDGVFAYDKAIYKNGNPVEIIFVKKNLTNLYGTLTYHFTARERFIFSNNKLSKRLIEIPEKSLSEVKKAINHSNQFKFIDGYIFSDDYESVCTVFLNSDEIVTVQLLPTNSQKFPTNVQRKIDSIFQAKFEEEERKQIEKELYEQEQIENNEDEVKSFVIIEDKPMFEVCKGLPKGRQQDDCFKLNLDKHIRENFRYPEAAAEKGIQGRVLVQYRVDKDGIVSVIGVRGPDKSLEDEARRIFEKLPPLIPAKQHGKAVAVTMSYPMMFRLN